MYLLTVQSNGAVEYKKRKENVKAEDEIQVAQRDAVLHAIRVAKGSRGHIRKKGETDVDSPRRLSEGPERVGR